MAKEIKFKAGKKKQHESLMLLEHFEEPLSRSERGNYDAHIKLPEEIIQDLYKVLERAVQKAVKAGDIPKGTVVTHDNAHEYSGLIFMFSHLFQALKDAEGFEQHNRWRDAYYEAINMIPKFMELQRLLDEDEILAGRSRTEGGNKEKARKKEERIALAKPIFNGYLSKGHSKNRAAELTAQILEKQYDVIVKPKPETIRNWFKGK